jgi:MFS family permease
MRGAGFSAASGTVFLLGIALFGSMLLLPLYYQIDRGESPLVAGLLLAPQGLGAAFGMNIGGRMTDVVGAGRVVLVGLTLLLVGTLVFTQVDADTSYWLLSGGLFLRGLGLGASMMPTMAGAYATLQSHEVPRATPMLNVLQRVGGSLGAALLVVILQNRMVSNIGGGAGGSAAGGGLAGRPLPDAVRERVASPIAEAFAHTYWWAVALTAAAFVPAAILAVAERRARREQAAAEARGEGGAQSPHLPAAA